MTDLKKIKFTVIDFETFTDYEFVPPSTFFIRSAIGDYYFIHTAKRAVAQEWVDDKFGKGRYAVVASKLQKTKSKSESGALTCSGTATRKK